jgi:hypothetical protein
LSAGHIGVQRERARLAALDGHVAEAQTTLAGFAANDSDAAASAYLGYLLLANGCWRTSIGSAQTPPSIARRRSAASTRAHMPPTTRLQLRPLRER